LHPSRTRTFISGYTIDILRSKNDRELFYYLVTKDGSTEIVSIGHDQSYEEAEKEAVWTVRLLTGEADAEKQGRLFDFPGKSSVA
jgi:hypothetical protein